MKLLFPQNGGKFSDNKTNWKLSATLACLSTDGADSPHLLVWSLTPNKPACYYHFNYPSSYRLGAFTDEKKTEKPGTAFLPAWALCFTSPCSDTADTPGLQCTRLTMLLWWALVMSSIRPTRSVVETPCVRLHSRYRPSCFTSAYVSFPSTVRVMSSRKHWLIDWLYLIHAWHHWKTARFFSQGLKNNRADGNHGSHSRIFVWSK